MIWYQERVTVQDAPPGSTVRLYGVYNPPEDQATHSMIEIKVEVNTGPDDTALILTLYSHNPTGLGYQETPAAEDIRERYNAKILKARMRLESSKFNEIQLVKKIP